MYVRPPRPSVYLTLRLSVIRQTSRPAHMYFCLHFFLYLYASTPAYPSHSYTQCPPHSVSVFLRSYVRISCSQLYVRASVCHIHVYYTSLSCISATVCQSTCLCVCLFSCKYITCTVVCPSVCYIRASSSEYAFVCLAVFV